MVTQLSPAVQEDYRRDLLANEAPAFLELPSITPVWPVGGGVPRPAADQSVRSTIVLKSAIATTQSQIATVSATERIFFLGVSWGALLPFTGDTIYVEDADSGAITPSDASTVGLWYFNQVSDASADGVMLPVPRECKRGIRVQMVKGDTTETAIIVYWMIERKDGQQQPV